MLGFDVQLPTKVASVWRLGWLEEAPGVPDEHTTHIETNAEE